MDVIRLINHVDACIYRRLEKAVSICPPSFPHFSGRSHDAAKTGHYRPKCPQDAGADTVAGVEGCGIFSRKI